MNSNLFFFSDNMTTTLESLPNEILLIILSNIRWFELIESFWSLNKRFNSLINSKLSINFERNKNGILIGEGGLSYNQCQSILLPIISNSSISADIQRIHIDGTHLNSSYFITEWIFHEKVIRFVNLKTLILTQCDLSEILITHLSLLIEYQLEELILMFDEDIFEMFNYKEESHLADCDDGRCELLRKVLDLIFIKNFVKN